MATSVVNRLRSDRLRLSQNRHRCNARGLGVPNATARSASLPGGGLISQSGCPEAQLAGRRRRTVGSTRRVPSGRMTAEVVAEPSQAQLTEAKKQVFSAARQSGVGEGGGQQLPGWAISAMRMEDELRTGAAGGGDRLLGYSDGLLRRGRNSNVGERDADNGRGRGRDGNSFGKGRGGGVVYVPCDKLGSVMKILLSWLAGAAMVSAQSVY